MTIQSYRELIIQYVISRVFKTGRCSFRMIWLLLLADQTTKETYSVSVDYMYVDGVYVHLGMSVYMYVYTPN